ncbi:MAG: hypothetical protein HPY83_10815 [Anaerolineae bacterium]|nr:hypothetical protein [Anaerolineae bacterium]
MDHFGIVRRALRITLRYRMLWVFGLLLAACSGSGGGGTGPGYRFDASDVQRYGVPRLAEPDLMAILGVVLAVVVVVGILAIFLGLVATVISYLSHTALIRAVDDYEVTGIRRSLGEGIRIGWSWRAARLFLIDLVVTIPTGILFVALFFFALAPLLLWATGSDTAGIIGTVTTVGLVVLVIMLGLLVALALSLLRPFFWRAAVLEDRGVFEAIGRGFRVVRDRFKDAAVMWLILLAIRIAYGLAVVLAAIVLAILGLMVGGLLGWVTYALASLVFYGSTPAVLGVLLGVPVGLTVLVLPLLFLSSLAAVFRSTLWTLTYRELAA